jgi:hypothetical protein
MVMAAGVVPVLTARTHLAGRRRGRVLYAVLALHSGSSYEWMSYAGRCIGGRRGGGPLVRVGNSDGAFWCVISREDDWRPLLRHRVITEARIT